jgi:hypothetical protein
MATKKLSEILGAKIGVDLEFVGLQTDETRDGLPIVRLILKQNIPVVYGRQITDTVTGDRVRLEALDVEMVSIGKDALDEIEALEAKGEPVFTWTKEGESGHIKCGMKLDVSNNQEVWITKEGFAKFGANRRNQQRQQRTSNLVASIRAAKTNAEFKGTDVNNPDPAKVTPTPVVAQN